MKLCKFELPDEYSMVSHDIIADLSRLLEHGVPVGGFLESVLDNDLRMAVSRADMRNASTLKEITRLIFNYVPGVFGYKGSVSDYIFNDARYIINEHGQAERLQLVAR